MSSLARLDSTESARDSGQESVSLFLPLDTNKIGVKTTGLYAYSTLYGEPRAFASSFVRAEE